MISTEIDEKGWYTVDLHVHTPASKDYKGQKTKEEYRNIVLSTNLNYKKESDKRKSGKEDDSLRVKIIAITDHNTVDGFKNIMGIKRETSDLIKKLKERDPNLEYIKRLQEEEAVFNSVHILMGVEVKPYPGIHLLIIFHEDVPPEMVQEFLKEGLDSEYEAGQGNPDQSLIWNIEQTLGELQKRFGNKASAIAPHVDSSAGLYEGLKDLKQPRINAFKHAVLKGVSFNNVETRDKISNLLKSPDYKRSTPLAFLQSSDFHGQPGYYIGFLHSKIYLGEKRPKYNSLFEALNNEKYVKCSADFVHDTYKKLIEGFSVQSFSSCVAGKLIFNEADYRSLCDAVCAYLNTNGGIIEMTGNVSAAEDKSDIVKELENNMRGALSSRLKPSPTRYEIKTLQMSNSKYRALVLFQQSSKLFMCDGKILTLKNNSPCPADPREIEYIVARNLNSRFGLSLERKLKNLSYEAKRASKFQPSYPLVVKFSDKFEFSIRKCFNITLIDESHDHIDELERKLNKYPNGMDLDISNLEISVGEYPPRLGRSYLRLSLPSYTIPNLTEKNAIFQEKRALMVIPDGAVMVSAGQKHLHVTQPTILSEPKDDADLLLHLAWFKSSYLLWYCATIIGETDLFQLLLVEAYFRIPIPGREFFEKFRNVSNDVRNLLLDEKKYLKEVTKLIDKESTDEVNKLTEKHNEVGDAHCRAIDMEIFKYLGLSSSEAMDIYNTLHDLDIYDLKVTEEKDLQEQLKTLDKHETK